MNETVIDLLQANQRLDKFLLKQLNLSSKGFIYKMLRKKRIKLNGQKAEGNEILKPGDIVKYYLSPETIGQLKEEKTVNPNAGVLDVLYEDDNVIIAEKPQGVLTHSDKPGFSDTMADRALLYASKNGKPEFVPVCVNRLDRNTSGLIAIAKNLPSAQWLAKAFREQMVKKIYTAVVHGKISSPLTIYLALEKDVSVNKAVISNEGRQSITEIIPVIFCDDYSVLEINLITGRTHQIRAHLSHIGYPVLGDMKYLNGANSSLEQKYGLHYQLLHCNRLMLTEKEGYLGYLYGREFTSPLPETFRRFTSS